MLLNVQPLLHTVDFANAGPAAARHPASTAQASKARTVRLMVPSISSSPLPGLDGESYGVSAANARKAGQNANWRPSGDGIRPLLHEIRTNRAFDAAMPCDPRRPDLAVVMPLDPHT